jgi:hypothetical protein
MHVILLPRKSTRSFSVVKRLFRPHLYPFFLYRCNHSEYCSHIDFFFPYSGINENTGNNDIILAISLFHPDTMYGTMKEAGS